jgi:nucleoside-diphosphate kinase
MALQKTLVVLKPDAVRRGLCGEIVTRFERVGLKICASKVVTPSKEFFHHHYEAIGQLLTRRGEKAFEITLDSMISGPVFALVLEGDEACEVVRKLVWPTEPRSAPPGTIRGDYAHMSYGFADEYDLGIPNLVHASGNLEEANQEIAHWFQAEEIFDYEEYTRLGLKELKSKLA